MANDGRGNFGNPEEHAKAGSMSSGNKNAAQNLEDNTQSKGGQASATNQNMSDLGNMNDQSQGQNNNSGNFANRPQGEVEKAARKGGQH